MNVIENILNSKRKLYISLTGGGSSSISQLLENGGASNVFIGGRIPYNESELTSMIGYTDKAVSAKTAVLLSQYVYNQPCSNDLPLEGEDGWCVGIGVTCSLVKPNERKDREHIIFLATCSIYSDNKKVVDVVKITLDKTRTRKQEEDLVSRLILSFADCRMNLTKAHPLTHKPWLKWIGLSSTDIVDVIQI